MKKDYKPKNFLSKKHSEKIYHHQNKEKYLEIIPYKNSKKFASKKEKFLDMENAKEEESIQIAISESFVEITEKTNKKEEITIILTEDSFGEDENELKEEYDENYGICPITRDYMDHPMLTPSGNYYEKSAIIKWINENHTDPITREYLTVDQLMEDNEYRKKIREIRKKRKNRTININ